MTRKICFIALLLCAVAACAQDPQSAPPGGQGQQGPQGGREGRRGGMMMMRGQGTGGTITAINGNTITLQTMNGGTATVKIADSTQFRRDGQPAKLSDFKVGERVMVRGTSAGENTWTAEMVGANPQMEARMREGLGKEFIAGRVTAIDGTKITVDRIDGQSQTIEVDENTSFRKMRDSITLADIKVGDQVMGRGAVKNGVFVPTTLNVGEPGQMRMRMGEQGAPPKQPQQ